MRVEIKFCGLTRAEDVEKAVELGCDYVGVIFAGGPRNQTLHHASRILRDTGSARRVGVFGAPRAAELDEYVNGVPLSVAQLHGDSSARAVLAARAIGVGAVWAVLPVAAEGLGERARELFLTADAVVLDTRGANGLGGTGQSFEWEAAAREIAGFERRAKLVVAGGLGPHNVARAIELLKPDIVDVSSGVESAPGIKDPILMSRFVEAARSA
jgi:phosphoribosylanthranilate isomerase